jgi:hypothetical protein
MQRAEKPVSTLRVFILRTIVELYGSKLGTPPEQGLEMKKAKRNDGNGTKEQIRDGWLQRLASLVGQIERWGNALDWTTRRIEKRMSDSRLGEYKAPALLLQKETVRILFEPITHSAPGADGVADLYLMPAYDDIASLYHCDGKWHLHYLFPGAPIKGKYTAGDAESQPLTKTALRKVLNEMTKHAVNV